MENNEKELPKFGEADGSYRAAFKDEGIKGLCKDFYFEMHNNSAYKEIRDMHTEAFDILEDKLFLFLTGWLGGPRRYALKYGSLHIPSAHAHLPIESVHRDQWLNCMKAAVAKQNFSSDFNSYLMEQLFVPAERIRQVCQTDS